MGIDWIAAFVLVAASSGAEPKTMLRDSAYGYAVSPPRFASPPPGASVARLTVLAPPEGGFSSNMGVMVQEMKTTREEHIALSQKGFAAAGFRVRSSSKRDVSGIPAVVFDYEGKTAGRSLRFLSLGVVLRDRVLLVTYTAEADKFPALEIEFKRSLDSFILVPE